MFSALFKVNRVALQSARSSFKPQSFNLPKTHSIIPSFSQIKFNTQPTSWISTTSPLLKKKESGQETLDFVDYSAKPVRGLTLMKRRTNGRNSHGHITVRHRGGGARRRYRIIDFQRRILDIPAQVQRLEYDPNRSAPIILVTYQTGEQCYQIATAGMKPGDVILTSETAPVVPGNTVPLYRLPLGTFVHNIELIPGNGSQVCRAGGASAQVLKQAGQHTIIKFKSGEIRRFDSKCWGTVGSVAAYNEEPLGKAGRSRNLGRRPHVRGTAMNPVDHPHGGGQGKTSGGRPSVSPWGILTKGYPTRRPKKITKSILIHRRKAKRLAREAEQTQS